MGRRTLSPLSRAALSRDTVTPVASLLCRPLLVAAGLVVLTAPAAAKDKPPLPDPMACPIDAPLRVASSDRLKHFTALSQCEPAKVVVAPRTDFEPSPPSVPVGDLAEGEAGLQTAVTRRTRKRAPAAARGALVVEQGRLDTGQRFTRIYAPDPLPEPADYGMAPSGAIPQPFTITGGGAPALSADPAVETVLAARPRSYSSPFDQLITDTARRHGVDPLMLHAVIKQESRYRNQARSHVGARGLMQIMPGTGSDLGVANADHLYTPATNIDAGARYLKRLWRTFGGRFDLVLAAYNAGPGAVSRYGNRVPPFRETRDYVAKVQAYYYQLAAENGLGSAR